MAKGIHRFDEVIGHKNVVRFLERQIKLDKVPNVMLLYGVPGIGKSMLARLTAIDVTTKYKPELKDKYTVEVIDEDKDVDSIKIFYMTKIQEKEEEIQKVKAEMQSIGFSSTGRKVIILDEAHGMSKKAQDAILPELEHLPEGMYVFMCTTEVGVFREALMSRASRACIRLNELSSADMYRLIKQEVDRKHISFTVNQGMVISMIASYAHNRPRDAKNLLENFEEDSLVTAEDLNIFFNTGEVGIVIELVKYLYGNMAMGIDYISNMTLDVNFIDTLIEVTKVALGHTSKMVSSDDSKYIKGFMSGTLGIEESKDPMCLIRFVSRVSSLSSYTTNRVISAFMNSHVDNTKHYEPKSTRYEEVEDRDLQVVQEHVEKQDMQDSGLRGLQVSSLEALLNSGTEVKDQLEELVNMKV